MWSEGVIAVATLAGTVIAVAAVLMRTGQLVQKQSDLEEGLESFKLKQAQEFERLKGDLNRQIDQLERSISELRGYLLMRGPK